MHFGTGNQKLAESAVWQKINSLLQQDSKNITSPNRAKWVFSIFIIKRGGGQITPNQVLFKHSILWETVAFSNLTQQPKNGSNLYLFKGDNLFCEYQMFICLYMHSVLVTELILTSLFSANFYICFYRCVVFNHPIWIICWNKPLLWHKLSLLQFWRCLTPSKTFYKNSVLKKNPDITNISAVIGYTLNIAFKTFWNEEQKRVELGQCRHLLIVSMYGQKQLKL